MTIVKDEYMPRLKLWVMQDLLTGAHFLGKYDFANMSLMDLKYDLLIDMRTGWYCDKG